MEAGKPEKASGGPLAKVDEGRRAYLQKLAAGTAFVVPLVASFSTDGVRFNTAEAGIFGGNESGGLFAKIIQFLLKLFGRHP
jgi:hypothetical protein